MKKIGILLFFTIILLSCEKDYLIPNKDVPDWLKTEIKREEDEIKDSPELMNGYGGWLRYEWKNEHYFEYHNSLSSSLPRAISFNRDTLNTWATDENTDYYKEKCCKTFVWKGPKFSDTSKK